MDSTALFQLIERSRQKLAAWMPFVNQLQSVADVNAFLAAQLTRFGNQQALSVMIMYNGQPSGMISFNELVPFNNSTQLVYWLYNAFVVHNIMHRAVVGMCELGFQEDQLNKITILAAVENNRSNAVAQKAGFHFDGIERDAVELQGGYQDCNVWSLLRKEWQFN